MAVEIAIDTNRYRDFVDGNPDAISVPLVVIAELRAGFAVGSRGYENERVFEAFLHRPRVHILVPTLDTTRHYATLFRRLRAAGTPIPTNDLWIAAPVIQHDIALYSRDVQFDAIPQLMRVG